MKKFLLTILVLFAFVNVNASTNKKVNNIKIESIDVKVKENIGYNEELKVSYSINPRDAKDLNLTWSIEGLKKGVTATFVSSKKTSLSDGEVVIKLNNTLNKDVTLTLKASQNGKTISTTKLVVESEKNTYDRVTKQLNDLITNLDEKINNKNYDDTKEKVELIDELLDNNSKVKDSLDKELLEKFNNVKSAVNEYKPNNKAVVIGVTAGLVVVFSSLIFWIFKKEGK